MRRFILPIAAIWAVLSGCTDLHLPLTHSRPQVARHQSRSGEWQLEVRRDRFTGEIACRLYADRHRVYLEGGAVAFRFPRKWNTTRAIYRLDGREPHHWREDVPELIRIGAPFEQGGVDNPNRGLVWIPLRRLTEANSIAIEARPDRAPVTFRFAGLHGLYQIGVERGCAPDARFVR